MSSPMKTRGKTEFLFPLYNVLTVADGIKQKKAATEALMEPWECTWT